MYKFADNYEYIFILSLKIIKK